MLLWSDEASRYALNVHTGQVHAADFALSRWSSLHWVPFMDAFAWSAGREVRFAPREGPGGMSLGPFMDGLPGGLALSHQGHTVAVAESTDHVSFWDARKERMRWRLKLTGAARFERMALSGDTWYLATARGPRVRLLWAYTGREVAAWPPHGGAAVRALAFARDGRRLATVGADDRVRVWSVPEPRKERR
jgi:WD40 repeat protein